MNRTPSQLLNGKTSFEKLYVHVPSFKHLRVFGCLAYAHNINHRGDKFATRSRRCVFLGYPSGKKGWLLLDREKHSIFTSRDVVFCENQFPFASVSFVSPPPTTSSTPELGDVSFDESDSDSVDTTLELNIAVENTIPTEVEQTTPIVEPQMNEHVTPVEIAPELPVPELLVNEQLGRGHRTKVPSSRLRDYVVNIVILDDNSLSSTSPSPQLSSGSVYPISAFLYHLIIFCSTSLFHSIS